MNANVEIDWKLATIHLSQPREYDRDLRRLIDEAVKQGIPCRAEYNATETRASFGLVNQFGGDESEKRQRVYPTRPAQPLLSR